MTVVLALCESTVPVRVPSAAPARSDVSSPIPVDIRRFPWIRRLAADYAHDFRMLAPFVAGDPAAPSAWTAAIARAQAQPHDRAAIAAIVSAQQERRGAPGPARQAAGRLADPATTAVVTGQQAGLFGGPLYTLLKAISAVRLAAAVEQEDGTPVVAVFWIDADDHDWDEVRTCPVFDERLEVARPALPPRTGADVPVGHVHLDARGLAAAIEGLEAALPETEFRSELIARVREAYHPGVRMPQAFGRWLESVLGDRGLVVFDASDPASKALAKDVFARELEHPGETARLARDAGARLSALGYHAQVEAPAGSVALFRVADDGARHAVRFDGAGYSAGDARFEPSRLAEEARANPAAFSPGVLLRPIVQDTLFPTICYVAGPSELAYLAQLREVYDRFDIAMPLVYPRASATILDAAALRFLTKYDVPFESLQPLDEAALNALLQTLIPADLEAAFGAANDQVAAALGAIAGGIGAIDPTLKGATHSTLGRMQHDLQTLHNKMIAAAKRRDDTLRRQFTRTRALAFPGGEPQERAIGFIWFLNQYGPALVDRLAESLPLDVGVHWVLSI